MLRQKRKNAPLKPLQTAPLILLWCTTYAIGFAALWFVTETAVDDPNGKTWLGGFIGQLFHGWEPTNIFFLFGLVIPALLQMPLVRRFLTGASYGWLNMSVVGLILSWSILSLRNAVMTMTRQEMPLSLPFLMFGMFAPTALIQSLWLHQYVKRAQSWLLASMVGTCVFLSIHANTHDVGFLIGGTVYGLIMGSTLFYLHIDALWSSPGIDQGEAEYA